MRSRWPGRIVASLLCAAVVAAVAWSFRPLPVEVDLATVSRGDVLVTVDEEGRTRVRERLATRGVPIRVQASRPLERAP